MEYNWNTKIVGGKKGVESMGRISVTMESWQLDYLIFALKVLSRHIKANEAWLVDGGWEELAALESIEEYLKEHLDKLI